MLSKINKFYGMFESSGIKLLPILISSEIRTF